MGKLMKGVASTNAAFSKISEPAIIAGFPNTFKPWMLLACFLVVWYPGQDRKLIAIHASAWAVGVRPQYHNTDLHMTSSHSTSCGLRLAKGVAI